MAETPEEGNISYWLKDKSPEVARPNRPGYGYHFLSGSVIGFLLYMEDIKLYAGSERDIYSLIHITRIYSNDMRMSSG